MKKKKQLIATFVTLTSITISLMILVRIPDYLLPVMSVIAIIVLCTIVTSLFIVFEEKREISKFDEMIKLYYDANSIDSTFTTIQKEETMKKLTSGYCVEDSANLEDVIKISDNYFLLILIKNICIGEHSFDIKVKSYLKGVHKDIGSLNKDAKIFITGFPFFWDHDEALSEITIKVFLKSYHTI